MDRLKQERIKWRQKHPFAFWAKPVMREDGTTDLKEWEAAIPGPQNTPWEGGLYSMKIFFPDEYPSKAPRLFFNPPLFHPNVYPSGEVCSSMLNSDWQSTYSITDLLLATQQLLSSPHPSHPAQAEPFEMYTFDREGYEARVRKQAREQCSRTQYQIQDDATNEQKYLGMDVEIDENVRRAASAMAVKKPVTISLDGDENTGENSVVT